MRVLHVHSGNLYGGIESILVCLAKNRHLFAAMDPEFALCFEGRLSRNLIQAGVPVHLLGAVHARNPISVWRARARLREVIQERHFDVVICHSSWTQTMFGSVARSLGSPLVRWQHAAFNGLNWPDLCARFTPPDFVICVSEFVRSSFANVFPDVPSAVIYAPVSEPENPQPNHSRFRVRAELRTSDHDVVIVQVARMEAGKGHILQLQALAMLREVPNWTCWFVGGAQRPSEIRYFDGLQDYARAAGIAERVRFLGDRADIGTLLSAADLLCHPTTGPEGFGIVLVEGLYAQVPVIAADLGALREIVVPSCGLLVPPADAAALARSLMDLVENPVLRADLGTAGAARARQLCDPAAQMNKIGTQLAALSRKQQAESMVRYSDSETGA